MSSNLFIFYFLFYIYIYIYIYFSARQEQYFSLGRCFGQLNNSFDDDR